MSKTKRRLQAQKREAAARGGGSTFPSKCLNCGEKGPHFVPPSFGDAGFFMCIKKVRDRAEMENLMQTLMDAEMARNAEPPMSNLDEIVAEQDFERKIAHKWLAHLGYSPVEIAKGESPPSHNNCEMEGNFFICIDGETDKSNHPLQDEIGKEISTVVEILELSGVNSLRGALQDVLGVLDKNFMNYDGIKLVAVGEIRQAISNRIEGEK